MHLSADEVRAYFTDGRRVSFMLERRLMREVLGGNLRHLILLLDDLQATGVAFVSLSAGIDATTPAGRLQLHVLGAIAEFERERIKERVVAGLASVRAKGQRMRSPHKNVPDSRLAT